MACKRIRVVLGRDNADTIVVYRGGEAQSPLEFTRMQLDFDGVWIDSDDSPDAFDFDTFAESNETVLRLGHEGLTVGYYPQVAVYVFDAEHEMGALRGYIEAEVLEGAGP